MRATAWPELGDVDIGVARPDFSRGAGRFGGLVLRLSRAPALCCKRRGSQSELAGGLTVVLS